MNLSDFDYFLDESLIAQLPTQKRENSRLLYLNRNSKIYEDKNFSDIIDLLSPNDLLVLAGKGHEDYQIIQGVKHHMYEKEIVLDYLKTKSQA